MSCSIGDGCPTGPTIKAYINFLKAYSKYHEHEDTNETLRKGIKAWHRLSGERKQEFINEVSKKRIKSIK